MNNETTPSHLEQLSEVFKSWFTEEELKIMEEKYKKLIEEQQKKDDEPMFGNH